MTAVTSTVMSPLGCCSDGQHNEKHKASIRGMCGCFNEAGKRNPVYVCACVRLTVLLIWGDQQAGRLVTAGLWD